MYTFLNAFRLARLEVIELMLNNRVENEEHARIALRCFFYTYLYEAQQVSSEIDHLIQLQHD